MVRKQNTFTRVKLNIEKYRENLIDSAADVIPAELFSYIVTGCCGGMTVQTAE